MIAGDPQNTHLGLLGWKLLRLIETHSDQLARGLLERIESSERCRHFIDKVPPEELRRRVYEIYHNLGEWLQSKSESDVEQRYNAIGQRRASQGVPLSEVIFVIVTTKEHLWEYVSKESQTDRPFELVQELELFQLVERFFDRAVYFAAMGYEQCQANLIKTTEQMKPPISPDWNSLARAEEALRDDHRSLEQLADLLQAAKDLPGLLSAAEELRQALMSHFAHEEHPGGLYDSLKFCVPQHREELAQLMKDHHDITPAVWQLCQRARDPKARLQPLRREAAQLVKKLHRHEKREHEMARQALGKSPPHRA